MKLRTNNPIKQSTLSWLTDIDKENNIVNVYVDITDEDGNNYGYVKIGEYNGPEDDDKSHDIFIARMELENEIKNLINSYKIVRQLINSMYPYDEDVESELHKLITTTEVLTDTIIDNLNDYRLSDD